MPVRFVNISDNIIARNQSECIYPSLWNQLICLYAPKLGPSGPYLYDRSMHNITGTLTGMDPATDWVVEDNKNWCLDLPTTTGWINLGSPPVLNLTGNFNLSIFALCKFNAITDTMGLIGNSVSSGAANNRIQLHPWNSNNVMRLLFGDGSAMDDLRSNNNGVSVGDWIHIGVTISSNNAVKFYRNGVPWGIATKTKSVAASSVTWAIGRSSNNVNYGVNGKLSILSIHNRVLTPGEIRQLYYDPFLYFKPKEQYWTIDQPTIDRYNNSDLRYIRGLVTGLAGEALNNNFRLTGNHIIGQRHTRTINVLTSGTQVLVANDKNKILSNKGATGAVVYELPAPAQGLRYLGAVENASSFKFTATNGAHIKVGTTVGTANGYIVSSGVGSTVELYAINNTTWVTRNVEGSWLIQT